MAGVKGEGAKGVRDLPPACWTRHVLVALSLCLINYVSKILGALFGRLGGNKLCYRKEQSLCYMIYSFKLLRSKTKWGKLGGEYELFIYISFTVPL